jgi:hypothetical protein
MPHYSAIEGEGVAGPLQAVSAQTTTLLSCFGLVMYNRSNGHAGLYHFGACTLGDNFVQGTILLMLADLEPTDIHIAMPPFAADYAGQPVATISDQNRVQLFLLEHAWAADLHWIQPARFANYGLVHGRLAVNDASLGERTATRVRTAMLALTPDGLGRAILGNISFYGGRARAKPDHFVDDAALLGVRRATGKNVFG